MMKAAMIISARRFGNFLFGEVGRTIFILMLFVLTVSAPIAAAQTEAETEDGTAPPAAEVEEEELLEPAVPVPDTGGGEDDPEWTYRYLIPMGIVLGLISVFVTVVLYFVRVVRARYQLVK